MASAEAMTVAREDRDFCARKVALLLGNGIAACWRCHNECNAVIRAPFNQFGSETPEIDHAIGAIGAKPQRGTGSSCTHGRSRATWRSCSDGTALRRRLRMPLGVRIGDGLSR